MFGINKKFNAFLNKKLLYGQLTINQSRTQKDFYTTSNNNWIFLKACFLNTLFVGT